MLAALRTIFGSDELVHSLTRRNATDLLSVEVRSATGESFEIELKETTSLGEGTSWVGDISAAPRPVLIPSREILSVYKASPRPIATGNSRSTRPISTSLTHSP